MATKGIGRTRVGETGNHRRREETAQLSTNNVEFNSESNVVDVHCYLRTHIRRYVHIYS